MVDLTALQLLFDTSRHHWFLSSLEEGDVRIYDSFSSTTLSLDMEEQLLQLYGSTMTRKSIGLCVSSMSVQQQRGSCDCGVFAIAYAFHIAAGDNIADLAFDQVKMRSHLRQCFENKAVLPFPTTRRAVKRNKLSNIVITVYCHCGRPDSLDKMIQCDNCDAWVHFQCAGIRRAPDNFWFCAKCRDS